MYTISRLCREYGLSRSTLLYYDKIGLLKPSGRSESNYRKYSGEDRNRLGIICTFREAGVSLEQIKALLDSGSGDEIRILYRRLTEINQQIRFLRLQQNLISEILKAKNAEDNITLLDKDILTSLFTSAGIGEDIQERFHGLFEASQPDLHQFFLELLGLPPDEIRHIRVNSKKN